MAADVKGAFADPVLRNTWIITVGAVALLAIIGRAFRP